MYLGGFLGFSGFWVKFKLACSWEESEYMFVYLCNNCCRLNFVALILPENVSETLYLLCFVFCFGLLFVGMTPGRIGVCLFIESVGISVIDPGLVLVQISLLSIPLLLIRRRLRILDHSLVFKVRVPFFLIL